MKRSTLAGTLAAALCLFGASAASAQEDSGRVRLGLDVGVGYAGYFNGMQLVHGVGLGLTARLGYQFNHTFALYYQGQGALGVVAGLWDSQAVGGVTASLNNSILVDFTILHLLKIGLGPAFDYNFSATCMANTMGSSAPTCAPTRGFFWGGDARVAVVLGSIRPGRRVGFSISLDVHPTFSDHGIWVYGLLGLGIEAH